MSRGSGLLRQPVHGRNIVTWSRAPRLPCSHCCPSIAGSTTDAKDSRPSKLLEVLVRDFPTGPERSISTMRRNHAVGVQAVATTGEMPFDVDWFDAVGRSEYECTTCAERLKAGDGRWPPWQRPLAPMTTKTQSS